METIEFLSHTKFFYLPFKSFEKQLGLFQDVYM